MTSVLLGSTLGAQFRDITWQSLGGGAAPSYPAPGAGSRLAKSSGSAAWNADGVSTVAIRGDGHVRFKFDQNANKNIIVGLAYENPDRTYTSINYAIRCNASGALTIYENGTAYSLAGSSCQPFDVFKIERVGTQVTYWQNAIALRTSPVPSVGSLIVDTCFFDVSGSISACQIQTEGEEEDVLWDEVGGAAPKYPSPDQGSRLDHSATASVWEGAVSSKLIPGDGYVTFKFGQTNKAAAIGLSDANPDNNITSIDFGIETLATSSTTTGQFRVVTPASRSGALSTYTLADIFSVERAGGQIYFYKNNALLGSATPAPTGPLMADASLYSASAFVTNCRYSGVSEAEKVVWASSAGASTDYLNQGGYSRLQKIATTSGIWDTGAVSAKWIQRSGYVRFRFGQANKAVAIGLSMVDGGTANTTIGLGLQSAANGTVQVVEQGILLGSAVASTTGDVFTIRRTGQQVRYEKNGVVFHQHALSGAQLTSPLLVDTSFADSGAAITHCEYAGVPADVLWRDLTRTGVTHAPLGTGAVDTSSVGQGSRLNKTATATTAAWNADGVSRDRLEGDGFVEFRIEQASKTIAVGLTSDNESTEYTSFPYALYFNGSAQFQVRELGTAVTPLVTYAAGDLFRIERRNKKITYWKNNTAVAVYESAVDSTGPLFVDTGFLSTTVANAIRNVVLLRAAPDSDDDGFLDAWEYRYFNSLDSAQQSGGAGYENDFDHDGIANAVEQQQGTDPTDYFNGLPPYLEKVDGDLQLSAAGAFAPKALTIRVFRNSQKTEALPDAPVRFTVKSGGGLLTVDPNNLPSYPVAPTITVGTLGDGSAPIFYQQPNAQGTTSVVEVTAGKDSSVAAPVSFTLYTHLLAGRWEFNEGTGAVAEDSSPWNYDGSLKPGTTNNPVWVQGFDMAGVPGGGTSKALKFNGSSSFVEVLHAPAQGTGVYYLNFASAPFSATAWVRLDPGTSLSAITNVYPVLAKWTATGGGFELVLKGGTGNGLAFRVMSNGAVLQEITASADQRAFLSDGKPHLVAFTRDASNVGRLYIDWNEVGSLAGMSASLTTTAPLWLGRNAGSPANAYLRGTLDDVRLLASTYRPDEIAGIYNAYDSDHDGLSDAWEQRFIGNLSEDESSDLDTGGSDGLTNAQEFLRGTNPKNRDSDGDTVSDGDEVLQGRNPIAAPLPDTNGTIVNLQVFTPLISNS